MTLKELAGVISPYSGDVKIISGFNGKIKATSHKRMKEFYDYEVSLVIPKIAVSTSKYNKGKYAKPYLEISISDYCDWVKSEDNHVRFN